MNNKILQIGLCAIAISSSCQKQVKDESAVVRIGGKTVPMASFEAFRKMRRMYPTRMPAVFPGSRSEITFMVEAQLIYDKVKPFLGKPAALSKRDWYWKNKFFPSHLYLSGALESSLGIGEEEVEQYYSDHLEDYKDVVKKFETIKVPAQEGDTTADSTGMRDSTASRDSTYYKSMAQVRTEIINAIFVQQNAPDDDFVTQSKEQDSSVTDETLNRMWLAQVRRNLPDFFMKKLYRQRFGEEFPDSLNEWFGAGKIIAPEDMEVILGWIPEAQRDMYRSDPKRTEDLAKWLLKWELLSQEAQRSGFMKAQEQQDVVEWAKKVQVAVDYVENKLVPKVESQVKVDSLMSLYAYWDGEYRVDTPPDSARFARAKENRRNDLMALAIDGELYAVRKQKKVEFLQSDWKDERGADPALLLAQADSARDSGDTKVAEELYKSLSGQFAFLPEGQRAVGELAKIYTESEKYSEAIRSYRRQLIWYDQDDMKKCNVFFMIGFIYDEYLGKVELAEVNYKWVLKYAPDCELSDDAEFMCLHLDEPMTSVEELRGEAERQGRNIEDDEPAEAEVVEEAS